MFDIYTIIFLALAVFIFFRLRSVLGQRTGSERPPREPFSSRESARPQGNDNVVPMPGRAQPDAFPAAAAEPGPDRWKGIPGADAAVMSGLDAIVAKDPGFDPQHFLGGARSAYEMIVTAFAQGDKRQLKGLLGSEVYEGFEAAINEREGRGEVAETRFVSIDAADLIGAELRGTTAQLTIRFVSKLISSTRDRAGNVIDGNPEKVTDVTDVWTFSRDTASRDPNWKLVATEAAQ